ACMLDVCHGLQTTTKQPRHEPLIASAPKLAPLNEIDIATWFQGESPVAIISDVHANLPALTAVLDDIDESNIQHILCLGDIVGYGPHPSECIKILQERRIFSIRGNHDYMVGSGKDFSHGSSSSLHVAHWTIDRMSQAEREWLATLPLQYWKNNIMLVHGAPKDPTFFNAYVYERTAEPNLLWMEAHDLPICFHGHSHLQGMYLFKHKQVSLHKELTTYNIQENTQSLICPGAVGQPRSGISGAEYAIYDPQSKQITFKRIDYDIEAVTQDMKRFEFPEQLITRLKQGL
ncbi:MAG: metallophosphoesterase family protein, partial [Ghiorsea sp.]|nr:metallophosphoesterase family protein [Ghiorsea sp.]